MRNITFLVVVSFLVVGCDDSRVYEKNYDFHERQWLSSEMPSFDFIIQDTTQQYNLLCQLRNSVTYPYSRIFITYSLQDSIGNELKKEMLNSYLFNAKTGTPNGSSGLGDIYDQQLIVLEDFTFKLPGKYSMKFKQFMRTDTLQGILSVGLRVETTTGKK